MEGFDKKIQDTVNESSQDLDSILEAEVNRGKYEMPPVHVAIRYSHHGSAKDAEGLKEAIEKCDIFMPELAGWTVDTLKTYTDVSNGVLSPEEACKRDGKYDHQSFIYAQYQALFGSKKKIGFIDIPMDRRFTGDVLNLISDSEKIPDKISNLDEVIKITHAAIEKDTANQKKREKFMLDYFPYELDQIVRAYPELRKQKELYVLLQLGAGHTGVYHELKQDKDFDVKMSLKNNPQIFRYTYEGSRRSEFGLPIDDELVTRILIEQILASFVYSFLQRENIDSNSVDLFLRKWVASLALDEIKSTLSIPDYSDRSRELLRVLSAKNGFTADFEKLINTASIEAQGAYAEYKQYDE